MKTACSCNRGIQHGPLKHASFALSICHCRFASNKLRKHPQLGGDFDVFNMKSRRICTLKIVVLCRISCSTVRDISRQPESFWIKRNLLQCVIKLDMRFTVWNSAPVCQLLTNCSQRSHLSVQCVFAVSEDRSVTETQGSQWQNLRQMTFIKQHSTGHQNGSNLHNLVNFDNLKINTSPFQCMCTLGLSANGLTQLGTRLCVSYN